MTTPNDKAVPKKMTWDPIFDLNRNMLDMLGEEFDPAKLVEDFAAQIEGKSDGDIDAIAADLFGAYGTRLMERTLELGDDKTYMDRGYEVLKEYAARPETGPFPYVIQRFVEVVYLGLNQKLAEVGILECNIRNVEFWIDEDDCEVYAALKEKLSPDVVKKLPCKHACACLQKKLLEAKGVNDCQPLHPMNMIDDDLCKFSLFREQIKLPFLPRMSWEKIGSDAVAIKDEVVDPEERELVLDIRELLPKKVIYETGGHYDRLKKGQVLKVLSAGDLKWLEKRLRMLRPGKFKCALDKDAQAGCYVATIERT